MRRYTAIATRSCRRSASTVLGMSGYCSLQATSVPSGRRGAMHLAQAGRGGGLLAERARICALPVRARARASCGGARRPSPSPARWPADWRAVRRIRRAARPARWRGTARPSSAALSGRPGSAADPRRGSARSVLMPNTRSPTTRAAMPPTAPEVRAKRRSSPNRSPTILGRRAHAGHPLQLVDEARDHVQPAPPERRIGGVEAERRQQFLVPLGAAGAQHVQVFGLERRDGRPGTPHTARSPGNRRTHRRRRRTASG